jgi:hypothetical protein
MNTHTRLTGEQAVQASVPVRPATGPKTARVSATPDGLLRRTLGIKVPSRRTLGGMALFSLAILAVAGHGQPADAQAAQPAVAQDMPGVVTTWYYPEDWGSAEPNPNCEHGLNQLVSTVTSRWTTSLCRVGDPQYPGVLPVLQHQRRATVLIPGRRSPRRLRVGERPRQLVHRLPRLVQVSRE